MHIMPLLCLHAQLHSYYGHDYNMEWTGRGKEPDVWGERQNKACFVIAIDCSHLLTLRMRVIAVGLRVYHSVCVCHTHWL